jgi:cysteinyl-tRNA synthetase
VNDASGEKMSKSLGNYDGLLDLIDQVDPRAYRLVLLQSHYRSPVYVGRDRLADAAESLRRFDALARRSAEWPDAEPDPQVRAAFVDRMDDDLKTPAAMAVLFDAVTQANAAADDGDLARAACLAAAVLSACRAVGLELRAADDIPDGVAAQIAALDTARAEKDYATADAIRAALQTGGWVVETTASGTTVRRP